MITIEQELLRTSTQTYRIGAIYLTNTKDRGWIAEIMFEIFDNNNNVIGTIVIPKTGQDYNQFWDDFNSGEYLYQLLVQHLNIQTELPNVEQEFVNPE